MKKLVLLLFVSFFLLSFSNSDNGTTKYRVTHFIGESKEESRIIYVGFFASLVHLAHGDSIGTTDGDGGTPP